MTTENALVQKPQKPIDIIRADLQKMEREFANALPEHITPERFLRVVVTAIQMNKDLLTASRESVLAACMKSAQDGLLPDGREAALVIYRTNADGVVAQYMPMIGGILKKVRNSGELASITSQIVYKNDKFRYWVDDSGEHLEHDPLLFGERGDEIGVYALAKTKDGAVYIEVLTKDQVMAVRASSRAKNGPWSGSFAHEMWRKTAIRRLSKRLPMSTDLEQVIHRDDDMIDLGRAETVDNADKGRRLAQLIGVGTAVAEPAKADEDNAVTDEIDPSWEREST